jgi:dienelactone hydrolase
MLELVESRIHYANAGRQYKGLLLERQGARISCAVVVLPDWRGISRLARDHAQFLVELGSTVVIADVYGNGFSPTDQNQVGSLVKQLIEHREEGMAAPSSCVSAMRERVGSDVSSFA